MKKEQKTFITNVINKVEQNELLGNLGQKRLAENGVKLVGGFGNV